jgi:hypothetical protein
MPCAACTTVSDLCSRCLSLLTDFHAPDTSDSGGPVEVGCDSCNSPGLCTDCLEATRLIADSIESDEELYNLLEELGLRPYPNDAYDFTILREKTLSSNLETAMCIDAGEAGQEQTCQKYPESGISSQGDSSTTSRVNMEHVQVDGQTVQPTVSSQQDEERLPGDIAVASVVPRRLRKPRLRQKWCIPNDNE